ncbi:hypothetical protein SprV_0802623300 [Sparganum proliferum]
MSHHTAYDFFIPLAAEPIHELVLSNLLFRTLARPSVIEVSRRHNLSRELPPVQRAQHTHSRQPIGAASQTNATSPAATTSAFSPDMVGVADVTSSAFFKSDLPESPSQKTPVDPAVKFLGEHASLINLEKLITPTPVCPVKTEPPKPSLFDLSSSTYQQPSWNNGPFTQQPANFLNQQQHQPFQGMSSQTYMQRSQTLQPAFSFQSSGLGPAAAQQQPSLFGSPMQAGPNSQPRGINGFGAGGAQWTGGAGTLQPSAFPPAASAAQINPFL